MLGEAREAWRRRLQAIGLFPNSDSWRRKHVLLLAAARAALAQGLPEAALVFQNEALENARAWQQPGGFEEVFAYRARTYIALGQHAAAVEDIKQARSWLARVPDRGLVARFEAELATTESLALASAAPSRAVEAATESIGKLTAAGGAFRLASAYLMRGQARLRADDPRNAEMDFSSGIEAFEAERNTIPSMRARLTAFPQGRELFKSLVAVKASLGKRDEAFAAAERGRARALLEALGHRDLVTSPSTVQAALASDEALLYYTVLEDRLLVWVIKNEGTWSTDRMIGSEPLSVLADRFRRELTSNAERTPAGETLYELLIGPLRAQVGSATSLVVVPDEALHTIPFAALRDRDRGRFLIEDYALTLAPSASVYVSKRPQQTARRSVRHALVVGVGRDESAANPLPLLPHAEQEAARVGDIYASRRVIVGGSATAQNFAAFAPDADVIHFAGHAVANEEYPALSRLVLAPDPGTGTTALYSYELSRLHFSATSMVVLAGCRTAAGANVLGEGLLSLARPFVEAGVPAVVGTLWDLDDRGAQEFFTTFHRAALKDAPRYALRTAQLSFVHAPKTELRLPSAWAGVVLISGASR
jgi:CHAT domain-containing protein